MPARLIAFEGVDGAGKSTALARVATALQAAGHRLCLPRLGKEHDSRPTREIRRLTRDTRNLDLDPRAELLLYAAREAQVLEEIVRPALARGETVLLDRSLLTPLVLSAFGRGVPLSVCESVTQAASGGLWPDLTLIFDVHPRTSRLRKRIEKIKTRTLGSSGRKSLAGSALKENVRRGYLELAQARGYPVFYVERATVEQLSARVLEVVLHGAVAQELHSDDDRLPTWQVPEHCTLLQGLEAQHPRVALFLSNGLRIGRSLRERYLEQEPELCAWALDEEDPLRSKAAIQAPDYALRGLGRKPLDPGDLRLALVDAAPEAALNALRYVEDPAIDALRTRLATSHPGAVLASLIGREDAFATSLRAQCWKGADERQRSSTLTFCASEEAWALRLRLLEKDPAAGLASLRGLRDPRADALLTRYAGTAPRLVLRALGGRSDDFSFDLRRQLMHAGREVLDSVRGLDVARAWEIRGELAPEFPSTVVHSLWGTDPEGHAELLQQCALAGAGDLHYARRLQGLEEYAGRPTWSRLRATLDGSDD